MNIEALACGLPVLTFNTGGSPEIIDETCGIVIEKGNVEKAKEEIIRLSQLNNLSSEQCRARAFLYDRVERFSDYIKLFKDIAK